MLTWPEKKQILNIRVWAFLLDTLAITFLTKAILWSYSSIVKTMMFGVPLMTKAKILHGLPKIEAMVFFIVFWGYYIFNYTMANGQTPGKIIFGLRVRSLDRKPLTFTQAYLRTFGHFLSYLTLTLPYIICFLRKDGKGLHDWPAKTIIELDPVHHYNTNKRNKILNKEDQTLIEAFPGEISFHENSETITPNSSQESNLVINIKKAA